MTGLAVQVMDVHGARRHQAADCCAGPGAGQKGLCHDPGGRHRDARHRGSRLHRLDLLPRSERLRDRADGEAAEPRSRDGSGHERRALEDQIADSVSTLQACWDGPAPEVAVLLEDESGFSCEKCRLLYPIVDEIPNFLVEEAKPLG